jgi:hypothetical protein
MPDFDRNQFPYTAFFCEENIWWLTHELVENYPQITNMQVLFLTNPDESIVLLNQKNTAPGQVTVWDYHVILYTLVGQDSLIFDFDSMLEFPVSARTYSAYTFPQQSSLPKRYQTWVRSVEAKAFLKHFHSDRSHMIDKIGRVSFPPYPPITPKPDNAAIDLSEYRNLEHEISESQINPLEDFLTYQSLT